LAAQAAGYLLRVENTAQAAEMLKHVIHIECISRLMLQNLGRWFIINMPLFQA
jgi:hypothetical protein